MPYLIDGHNLIPHVSGLSLEQLDDEQALLERLEAYFQQKRKQAVVYFDHAQAGGSPDIRSAFLQVHFVRQPAIADTAILNHLHRLGSDAHNWIVVSSDAAVRSGAQRAGARTQSSTAFAKQLESFKPKGACKPRSQDNDIDSWLKLFEHHS